MAGESEMTMCIPHKERSLGKLLCYPSMTLRIKEVENEPHDKNDMQA
jgi:hypothetical protein